jgi:hypothetical protein
MQDIEAIDASFEEAFGQTVELGNRMAEGDHTTDVWDVADGLLAGALQFWLYSRQPCGDSSCEDCTTISTAEERMKQLRTLIEQFTSQSEYFHSPQDTNVGRA